MLNKRASQSALNGARSTGPKTPEGLARCLEAARRPRKCRIPTLSPGESPERFEAFRARLHSFWQPENQSEIQMVDDLASIMWILDRKMNSTNGPGSLRACLRRQDRLLKALSEKKFDT